MKIPSITQIRELDQVTISKQYSDSSELMEHAALTFVNWFVRYHPDTGLKLSIFCGTGNNGGDGLAIARLLNEKFYNIEIYYCNIGTPSKDNITMLNKIPERSGIKMKEITESSDLPKINLPGIIIDAIFGTGLNRAVESYWARLLNHINSLGITTIAVDTPSGIWSNSKNNDPIIRATQTLSFEFPKIQFLLPNFSTQVGEWHFESIGLDKASIESLEVNNFYITNEMAASILKPRKKYSHKGSYGHAILIVGKYGMYGAALLSGQASLRAGLGLLTVHIPESGYNILQTALPEAMVSVDRHIYHFSTSPDLSKYNAIGIGCGLGIENLTKEAFKEILESELFIKMDAPPALLLDADALNIIAADIALLAHLPKGTIITPHPGECERLFGVLGNDLKQIEKLKNVARKHEIYIVLKRAHTVIICPDQKCYFNSTGNPGMATAGSGDILSGIITGLMAQGYNPKEACILGVYLHGLAGDLAVEHLREQEALIARDIIEFMGKAFKKIRSN